MIQGIFLDFDGVIMDSMGLKLESYCYALAEFDFDRDSIQRIQLEYTGESRNKVLQRMHQQITGREPDDETLAELVQRFGQHDDDSRALMEPLPGAVEFLEAVHRSHYLALVTGTPQFAIDATMDHHNLGKYFQDVCGSPREKTEILQTLRRTHKLQASECIMVGDGKTDQRAADANAMRFVGMACDGASFEPSSAWMVVTSLPELLPVIQDECSRD